MKRVKTLLAKGLVDLSVGTSALHSLLHYAAHQGRLDLAEALLLSPEDVEKPDINGIEVKHGTPLLTAAAGGTAEHVKVAQLLLRAGADCRRGHGKYDSPFRAVMRVAHVPLESPSVYNSMAIARLLIEHDRGPLDVVGNKDDIVLHAATAGTNVVQNAEFRHEVRFQERRHHTCGQVWYAPPRSRCKWTPKHG